MNLPFSDQLTHALGWTLLHSLWQFGLAALVLYLIITYSKNVAANFRYTITTSTLAISVGLVIGTFAYLYFNYQPAPQKQILQETPVMTAYHVALPIQGAYEFDLQKEEENSFPYISVSQIRQAIDRHASTVVIAWICGVILLSIRFLGGFAYTRRLKNHPDNILQVYWQRKVQMLANQIGLDRKIKVMVSGMAKVPMVIGHLKPVILLPASLLINLPADQLEAVLAHELAHIYRKDYWVNILQSLAEIIFFYHPALWWISSVIRTERENCCDDLAVSLCGNTITYAKALAQIEESRNGSSRNGSSRQQVAGFAMAITGKRGSLLQRIERLLHPHARQTQSTSRYTSALVMLLIVVTAGTGMAYKTYETPLRDSLANIIHMPQINFQDQWSAKVAAKATEEFQRLNENNDAEKQPGQISIKEDPCVNQTKHGQPCDKEFSQTVIIRKAVQPDTLLPLAIEEDLDLMLDLNLDSLWNIDMNLDLDVDPAVVLDTVPVPYFFNFSDGDSAFHFKFDAPDAPGAAFNWHVTPAPFDADTLFPPHAFHLSDSMMQMYLRPLDSLRMLRFQWRDSLIQSRIEKEMERTEKLMQRLHSKWIDSTKIAELNILQSQLQARLERNEEALRAQSEALAKQAEVLKKRAEEFEKKAAELEARAKEKEKEKNQVKSKLNSFDQSTRVLEKELLKDGFIEKGKQYKLELSSKELKINGKKQPKEVYQKYAKLLSKEMNVYLEKDDKFSLTKTPSE